MLPHEIFFYGGIFFLVGILVASLGALPLFVTASTVAVSGLFILFYFSDNSKKNLWFAGLLVFIIAGSVYYRIDDARFRVPRIPLREKIEFLGIVMSDPVQKDDMQEMRVVFSEPFHTNILIKTRHGQFAYGDAIKGSGVVEKQSNGGYARYLDGQYIRGTMSFPSVEKVGEHKGSVIKSALLDIKHKITNVFTRVLPPEEAIFLSGLTIGARGSFSPELKDAMQKSGTTHLVALSGQNISILVFVTMILLLSIMRHRTAFIIATLIIIGFVIMTGADASVIRAAIVGFIVLLANEIGRAHDIR
ncbi:MAG: ComEC/Rec2 family competence protein, partial [Patescibacteria group bacterium]